MVGDISTGTIRIENVILYLVAKTVVNPTPPQRFDKITNYMTIPPTLWAGRRYSNAWLMRYESTA